MKLSAIQCCAGREMCMVCVLLSGVRGRVARSMERGGQIVGDAKEGSFRVNERGLLAGPFCPKNCICVSVFGCVFDCLA